MIALTNAQVIHLWRRLADAAKVTPEEAQYVPASPIEATCALCVHFVEPDECELVIGKIAPAGICKLYERYPHDTAMQEKWDVALMRALHLGPGPHPSGSDQDVHSTGGGGTRSKFETRPEKRTEEDEQIDKFTRRETPAERRARIRNKAITPEIAASIRKALGMDSAIRKVPSKARGVWVRAPKIAEGPAEHMLSVTIGKPRPGDCYRAAGRYVMENTLLNKAFKPRLVHGKIGSGGNAIDHAWVVINDTIVFDGAQQQFYDKADYYDAMNVKETKSFDPTEMKVQMLKTKHWGPWT